MADQIVGCRLSDASTNERRRKIQKRSDAAAIAATDCYSIGRAGATTAGENMRAS
jgi:hypothetical protein